MSKTVPGGGRKRRRLAPSEKYEIYLSVVTKQATQREAAAQWGVDRSTVTHICRVAKQGSLDALAASVRVVGAGPWSRWRWRLRRPRSSG